MPKRKKILLPLLLTGSLLTVSCSLFQDRTPAGKPVNLTMWAVFEDEQALRPIIADYEKAHKNVHIILEQKDIATYEQDLVNALASGRGPDIFSIHNDWVPRYKDKIVPAPAGLFKPREYQEGVLDVVREDFSEADGKVYAVARAVDVLALYYNRDLLGSVKIVQPPQTWEEVIQAVKKLTRQDRLGNFVVNGIALGTTGNINRSTDILSLLMLQNGSQIYTPFRSQATLDRDIAAPDGSRSAPGPQALEFYTQFANPAKETYTWNARNNYSIDSFVAGNTAMMLSYSYQTSVIRNKNPLLNFGVAPVPQIDTQSAKKTNYANYFGDAVSKVSLNQQTAWDFLKFITSAQNVAKYTAARKTVAARKDILAAQIDDPDIGVFAEGAPTAKTFYKPDSVKVEGIFANMIDDVVLRGKTPAQAVARGNELLNDLLR